MLKGTEIRDDGHLLSVVNEYNPKTQRKSGVRALEDLVVTAIQEGVNEQNMIEMFGMLNVVVPRVAGDSLTQNTYYKIRKAVIAKYGKESEMYSKSLTLMVFDRNRWYENRARYNAKVSQANENPVQFSFDTVAKVVEVLMASNNYVDALLLLQFSSGARIGELLYFAEFEDAKPPYIKQIGVLKSKTDRTVTKPVLFLTVEDFLGRFKRLKEQLKPLNIKTDDDARKLNVKINRRVKQVFANKDLHTHDLRKIYADLSYKTYADKQQKSAWVSRVLGHDMKSIQVSSSYTTVNIDLNEQDIARVKHLGVDIAQDVQDEKQDDLIPVPRNTTARDGKALERLHETVEALKANGVKVTARELRKYGYGARTVKQWRLNAE
jgi:hypothetical protein